ncbi:hypothetical protein M404DRAFT_998953, partial [Pisolithus tinctorius Marx 270]
RVFIDEGGLWTSDVPQGSLMIMLNPLYRQFVWRDMLENVGNSIGTLTSHTGVVW